MPRARRSQSGRKSRYAGQTSSPVYYAGISVNSCGECGGVLRCRYWVPHCAGGGAERHRTASAAFNAKIHLSIPCRDEIIALMQKRNRAFENDAANRTWTANPRSSLKRVREHGCAEPPLKKLPSEAGVSPVPSSTTSSKEDAVLGLREPVVSEEISETDRLPRGRKHHYSCHPPSGSGYFP